MSETETVVPMDDKALFDSATSDAAPATVVETPAQPEQADAGPARDEAGRFAPKADAQPAPVEAEPAPAAPVAKQPPAQAEAKQEPPPGWIPAWRAREIADARAREVEARYKQQQPQEEIDPYADPAKFRDAGVRQAIDPVQQRMDALREHYSWKDAVRTHQQTAVDARKWFYEAVHAGDPNVAPVLQKAMQSIDPFDDIVTAYKQHKTLSTIGTDPEAWFQSEVERRRASDPEFAAKYLAPQQSNTPGAPESVVRLPPSLNRQPGSQGPAQGGMSDADLYAFAKS